MDVYGLDPVSKDGEHFCCNVGCWYRLVEFIRKVVPRDIVEQCRFWELNDGDGLDDEAAAELAILLNAMIRDGTIDRYLEDQIKPDLSHPQPSTDMAEVFGLTVAGDSGSSLVEDVRDFANFLVVSGGFKIY